MPYIYVHELPDIPGTRTNGETKMCKQPEVQGPYYLIEVINRRNGIQYGTKWIKRKPKQPKE